MVKRMTKVSIGGEGHCSFEFESSGWVSEGLLAERKQLSRNVLKGHLPLSIGTASYLNLPLPGKSAPQGRTGEITSMTTPNDLGRLSAAANYNFGEVFRQAGKSGICGQ